LEPLMEPTWSRQAPQIFIFIFYFLFFNTNLPYYFTFFFFFNSNVFFPSPSLDQQ